MKSLLFSIAALALLALYLVLLRRLSRWRELEAAYAGAPQADSLPFASFRGVTGRAGRVRLSLSVDLDAEGLHVAPAFPLSVSMRALMLPWRAIAASAGTGRDALVLRLHGCDVPLELRGRAAARVARHLAGDPA